MSGHGHVVPRLDGTKARCGGPAICVTCAIELAGQNAAGSTPPAPSTPADPLRQRVEAARDELAKLHARAASFDSPSSYDQGRRDALEVALDLLRKALEDRTCSGLPSDMTGPDGRGFPYG